MNIDSYLRRTYGITEDEYDAILVTQGGTCAICSQLNKPKHGEDPERLSVDHNHRTGENRGLLCQRCNKVLGAIQDSQELAIRILEYLRKHDGSDIPYIPYRPVLV